MCYCCQPLRDSLLSHCLKINAETAQSIVTQVIIVFLSGYNLPKIQHANTSHA
jgi:hypothetical protein